MIEYKIRVKGVEKTLTKANFSSELWLSHENSDLGREILSVVQDLGEEPQKVKVTASWEIESSERKTIV